MLIAPVHIYIYIYIAHFVFQCVLLYFHHYPALKLTSVIVPLPKDKILIVFLIRNHRKSMSWQKKIQQLVSMEIWLGQVRHVLESNEAYMIWDRFWNIPVLRYLKRNRYIAHMGLPPTGLSSDTMVHSPNTRRGDVTAQTCFGSELSARHGPSAF